MENGEIRVIGRNKDTGVVNIEYVTNESRQLNIKTVWNRKYHDSGIYGSSILRSILGESANFSFPKSVYSVKDAVAAIVRDRPNALILDFFAGSGTTLHAVNLLNALDNGQHRCILVINNEVSEEEAKALSAQGLRPGDPKWERHGICQSVTWPRSKYTILGRRDDGSTLTGEYLTGRTLEKERPRRFRHIGFVAPADPDTPAWKKQLAALMDGIPQSAVKSDAAFVVSEKHPAALLFDASRADAWLAAREGQGHVSDFYIVTPDKAAFDAIKDRVTELLGPLIVTEEKKHPMADGFPVNLEFFRLDFLDKDPVELGRRFREILLLL
uniref:DNA methylase n=1 Tax=Candidatus Kentrum eta TaxID=2126337 RepID=A0A450V0Q7_9GAMM|nr:MAG: DNA methylase [Candidatus Kentron sp. H]VFJ98388.1 MAG: DNA methylase [Candidatus Kentron sp. H]VFK03524.1 MAG: DNA methylase [Candidatus Kentron sp. H]